jgi:hypothetical protein
VEWGDADSYAIPHADSHADANPVSYCLPNAFGARPDAHSGSVDN